MTALAEPIDDPRGAVARYADDELARLAERIDELRIDELRERRAAEARRRDQRRLTTALEEAGVGREAAEVARRFVIVAELRSGTPSLTDDGAAVVIGCSAKTLQRDRRTIERVAAEAQGQAA